MEMPNMISSNSRQKKLFLFAILAFIALAIVYFAIYPFINSWLAKIEFEKLVGNKTAACLEYSINATQSYCTDAAYHNIAVEKNDTALCEKIQDSYLKDHCYRLLR